MNIEVLSPLLYRISGDGETHLGIRIGTGAARSAPQLAGLVQEPHLVIETPTGRLATWVPVGMVVHQQELVLYGPWLPDLVSLAGLDRLPRLQAMECLLDFHAAAVQLERQGRLPETGLFLEAWFRMKDGSVVVLSPKLQKLMLSLTRARQRIDTHACFQRAGLSDSARMAYGFGVLAFRVMTGNFPYDDMDQIDRLAAYQLHGVLRTPRCLITGVPQAVEDHYQDLFQNGVNDISLAESDRVIRSWWSVASGADLQHQIDETAMKRFLGRQERFRRRSAWKRHSWKFAIGAVSLVIGLVIGGTALSNLLRPLRTVGMTPEQVVGAFYDSVNTLDTEMIKDTVLGDAGKDMVGMVDNLYVISQIRFGTERKNVRMPANEWLAAGSPALDTGLMLFGIGGLRIEPSLEPVDQGDSRHFIARYDIYTAESNTNDPKLADNAHLVATVIHREDRLSLRKGTRDTWQIVSVDRRETAPATTLDIPRP